MSDPDRLAELRNAVGAQLVPGVLFDELFEIAERQRDLLARLEWIPNYSPRAACPACLGLRDQGGHEFNCWLAPVLYPGNAEGAPPPE